MQADHEGESRPNETHHFSRRVRFIISLHCEQVELLNLKFSNAKKLFPSHRRAPQR